MGIFGGAAKAEAKRRRQLQQDVAIAKAQQSVAELHTQNALEYARQFSDIPPTDAIDEYIDLMGLKGALEEMVFNMAVAKVAA